MLLVKSDSCDVIYYGMYVNNEYFNDGMNLYEFACIILLENFAHMFMCVQNISEDPDIGTVQKFRTESVHYRRST